MKFVKAAFALVFIMFLFHACQNELSYDLTPAAQGTLHDPNGDCYPAIVQGVYREDSALNSSHYIDVNVFFNVVGNYDIRTDTVNGFSFHAIGTANNLGLQSVRLLGTGQPADTGAITFQIRFDSSACDVTVNVISNTTADAEFTLGTTAGSCTGAVLAGTYTANTAMTSANTVTIAVSVTAPGPYNISTASVNGVIFSASGIVSATTTSIVLTAQGTPAASTTAGSFDYPLTAGTSACSFSVTYAGVPAGPAGFSFDCGTMDAFFPLAGERLRVGQVLNPSIDTITVQVNVITAGSYSITTTYGLGGADGVTFNTTGVFTSTGVQTLRLGASGTAGRGGIVFYNIASPQSTNGSPCSTGCYYEFLFASIDGGFTRNFTYLSDVVNDNSSLAGYDLVRWKGFGAATGAENVELTIGLPTGGNFNTTGSASIPYSANDFPGKYVKALYTDNNNPGVVYSAETNGSIQATPFTITITFCTAGRIEGNYSGVVKDNAGAGPGTKTISGNFGLWRL